MFKHWCFQLVVGGSKEARTVSFLVILRVLVAYVQFYFRVHVSFEEKRYITLSLTNSWVFYWILNLFQNLKADYDWFNRTILYWDNIKVFAPDIMCNLFIVYCKFFILHSAKAYLGPFQTYMTDFFAKNFIVVVWQVAQSAPKMVTVKSTWQCESFIWESKNEECLLEECLPIKVKRLSILDCPTVLPIDIFHGFTLEFSSYPRVCCTAILYIAFLGFFEVVTQMRIHNSYLSFFNAILRKKQILKGSLVRKIHYIMIKDKFRTLRNINDGVKKRYLFWQKAPSCLQGSKYASDDDCCSILRGHFQ